MTRPYAPGYRIPTDLLLKAYASGVFPMAESAGDPEVFWVRPETRGIINAQSLALMKKSAGLINVARGALCDERAVIAALQNGQIRCAHLDVFETEPLPVDSPLWEMPNLILTPHNASASAGNERRSVDMFLENLERWARGASLLNLEQA